MMITTVEPNHAYRMELENREQARLALVVAFYTHADDDC